MVTQAGLPYVRDDQLFVKRAGDFCGRSFSPGLVSDAFTHQLRRQRALALLLNSSRTDHRQTHVIEVPSRRGRPAHNVVVNPRPPRRLPLVLRRPAGGLVNPGTHK